MKHNRFYRSMQFLITVFFSFCLLCPFVSSVNLVGISDAAQGQANNEELAKKLQMEGTMLQLKGKKAEALKKYKESLAIKPNPRLQALVERLEKQINKKSALSTHHPNDEKEALVYKYVDWNLSKLNSFISGVNATLETNGNYSITREQNSYIVTLDPFIIHIDKSHSINLTPVIFRCIPKDEDRIQAQIEIPKKFNIGEAIITYDKGKISGLWNAKYEDYEKGETGFENITLTPQKAEGKLTIDSLHLISELLEKEGLSWQQDAKLVLDKLLLDLGGEGRLLVNKLEAFTTSTGKNYADFVKIKKHFESFIDQLDKVKNISDLKSFFADSDKFLDLFQSSKGNLSISGITFQSKGQNFKLNDIKLASDIKNNEDRHIEIISNITLANFHYSDQKQKKAQATSVKFDSLHFASNYMSKPIPKGLFEDAYSIIAKGEAIKDKKAQEEFWAKEGMAFLKKLAALIGKGSSEIGVNNLAMNNIASKPILLGQGHIRTGFDATLETGGQLEIATGFADLSGVDIGGKPIPRAMNIDFEIANIPSLLDLITDPKAAIKGGTDAIGQQVAVNGMSKLMTSALVFALKNTYFVFPTTRIDLNMKAKLDNKAVFKSIGDLFIKIENPEEFKKIIAQLSNDPSVNQLYATITAFANRTNKDGKTVDELNLKITKDGKIFINQKDVTDMFFPKQSAEQKQPAKTQGKAVFQDPDLEKQDPDSPVVVLERGMCLGPCPVYKVSIYKDGTVVFEGKKHVKIIGKATSKISPDEVKKLVYNIWKRDFFLMPSEYTKHDITDMPTVALSATYLGKTKRVVHYLGDNSAPRDLLEMEKMVDEVAKTQKWIKGD